MSQRLVSVYPAFYMPVPQYVTIVTITPSVATQPAVQPAKQNQPKAKRAPTAPVKSSMVIGGAAPAVSASPKSTPEVLILRKVSNSLPTPKAEVAQKNQPKAKQASTAPAQSSNVIGGAAPAASSPPESTSEFVILREVKKPLPTTKAEVTPLKVETKPYPPQPPAHLAARAHAPDVVLSGPRMQLATQPTLTRSTTVVDSGAQTTEKMIPHKRLLDFAGEMLEDIEKARVAVEANERAIKKRYRKKLQDAYAQSLAVIDMLMPTGSQTRHPYPPNIEQVRGELRKVLIEFLKPKLMAKKLEQAANKSGPKARTASVYDPKALAAPPLKWSVGNKSAIELEVDRSLAKYFADRERKRAEAQKAHHMRVTTQVAAPTPSTGRTDIETPSVASTSTAESANTFNPPVQVKTEVGEAAEASGERSAKTAAKRKLGDFFSTVDVAEIMAMQPAKRVKLLKEYQDTTFSCVFCNEYDYKMSLAELMAHTNDRHSHFWFRTKKVSNKRFSLD